MVMAYTLCKVKFKGERIEFSVASGSGIEHTRSLIPHTNNSRGLSVETEVSESQNLLCFSFLSSTSYLIHIVFSSVFFSFSRDRRFTAKNHRIQVSLLAFLMWMHWTVLSTIF